MKTIILAILLSAIFNRELPPPPELLPECISDYALVWQFDDSVYCQDHTPRGDYYLYTCRIQKWSNFHQMYYETIKHVSQCVYTHPIDISKVELFATFLPIVSNNNTIMSYIP